jgi:hypothetical protein
MSLRIFIPCSPPTGSAVSVLSLLKSLRILSLLLASLEIQKPDVFTSGSVDENRKTAHFMSRSLFTLVNFTVPYSFVTVRRAK